MNRRPNGIVEVVDKLCYIFAGSSRSPERYHQKIFRSGNVHKAVGIILLLFFICFIAIVIEEAFLAGRRRRKLERQMREARQPRRDT